jgi:hypothetical protein
LDWGLVPSIAELPNVAGATTQNADLVPGARAFVAGDTSYVCRDPALGAAVWSSSSGREAQSIVGFTGTAAVGSVGLTIGTAAYIAIGRDCSVTGLSVLTTTPPADDDIVITVVINGVPSAATATLVDGGSGLVTATFAVGAIACGATGAVQIESVGGALLSNTPVLYVTVLVTPDA